MNRTFVALAALSAFASLPFLPGALAAPPWATTHNPSFTGNVTLEDSTSASAGNILKGAGQPFIHNFGPGGSNTFIGINAGNFTMTGAINTGTGVYALFSNTTGSHNTATGVQALRANTTGFANTATGFNALSFNTTGRDNTAMGAQALNSNTTGTENTASGVNSLVSNTTGSNNTASGAQALGSNTTGGGNTASGTFALGSNTTGGVNTASGASSLQSNTTGTFNTATGFFALGLNTTGSNNIAVGAQAGINLTTGSNNIDIGHQGMAGESDTIRIGSFQSRAFIAGIRGVTTGNADAVAVVIDSLGQLGTVSSSRRFKDDIADMDAASSALMKLRPVTFHYKIDSNPSGRRLQYGLVAEEVAEVYPGLIAYSAEGQAETVMYQFLAPMLLNEYQKQRRTIEAQSAELARQTAELARQRQIIAQLEQDHRLQNARMDVLERQSAEIAELRTQAARMARLLDRLQASTIASR